MMELKRKNVLIIEFLSLPEEIQAKIREWCGFGNDCLVPLRSEFSPFGDSTWKTKLTQENLEKYHKDQIETNGFKGDLSKFIEEYNLEVDKFLIDQKLDLDGVEEIFINVSW